ncbi:3-oxoacyl-[acyl-carrier-protein] synthase-3 [Rhizobium mongolense subsp. loessense]|uniref:3-oxoacyl-[acyl-carrier-protein] synthase-3 n=1 Tax=Rhizobium mongolense subsp. loessense TaxID=158890 RepID=A0A1G4U5C2_9HYPH|nr:3-oxoacyl-[acyl-carrier-protein] synthase III C-terminal domain-containing protein [Rhizobium mongolense]SCW88846.1 3-oxoacyl-[acyl-carrier-protein] synthase-3 [Rhizobium mongolense subsp. loessense]
MLTLFDVQLSFPETIEGIDEAAVQLQLSCDQRRMFQRFLGFETFRCEPTSSLAPFLHDAARLILQRNEALASRLTHVVHCHTLPATSLVGSEMQSVLQPFSSRGLEVFSATMNHCATGLTALNILGELLDEGEIALVLIGERAFHRVVRVIENATIMGEAACAILVGHGAGPYGVVDSNVYHDGRFALITGRPDEASDGEFSKRYLEFACEGIHRALSRFGVGLGELRCVMPHNVNVPSWLQIAQHIGLDQNRISLSTISRYGHCFGADPFINLMQARRDGTIGPSDLVLLFSVGLGATASAALVKVN